MSSRMIVTFDVSAVDPRLLADEEEFVDYLMDQAGDAAYFFEHSSVMNEITTKEHELQGRRVWQAVIDSDSDEIVPIPTRSERGWEDVYVEDDDE